MSVAGRDSLQHLFHPGILELERRRLCWARRRMSPKQGLRKRPAAGSHETFGDLQPGFLLDDATRLERRATQAAMEAAAQYSTPNGFSISCICIGQPRLDDEPSPHSDDCEPNSKHWRLPEWPSQIRLAFKWEIFEGCSATATEAASCVVRLDNVEQRGVPLPAGWGPKVAALLDGSQQTAGEFRCKNTLRALQQSCMLSLWQPAQAHHDPDPGNQNAPTWQGWRQAGLTTWS